MTSEHTDPDEAPVDESIAELLAGSRPVPATGFRAALGRRLEADNPGWGPRPDHLWPQAAVLVIVGAILLLIGAVLGTGGL